MTPREEVRLLSSVLKRIQGPPIGRAILRCLPIASWLILVIAFFALSRLAPGIGPIIYVIVFCAAMLGALASFLFVYLHSTKQWPVLSQFVDGEGIKRRLDELKHNNAPDRTREG